MPFSDKDPAMQKTLTEFARRFYGRSISDALNNEICVCCGMRPTDIDDAEYNISGLCEECQPPDEDK